VIYILFSPVDKTSTVREMTRVMPMTLNDIKTQSQSRPVILREITCSSDRVSTL